MNKVITGTITLPCGVSNKETLLWFHKWVKDSSKDIENFLCIMEAIFFDEEILDNTLKFLLKNKWVLFSPNEVISPEGSLVRLIYDYESDKQLKEIKK